MLEAVTALHMLAMAVCSNCLCTSALQRDGRVLFQETPTTLYLTAEALSTCSLMLTQCTVTISEGHGLLQAPRLQLLGPGYDILPFELECVQPSRIKVQTGEADMDATSCAQRLSPQPMTT